MTPQRIQLRRTKGWRKPDNTVVVARPSQWGNPFRVVPYPERGPIGDISRIFGTFCNGNVNPSAYDQAVRRYRRWLLGELEVMMVGCSVPADCPVQPVTFGYVGSYSCWGPPEWPKVASFAPPAWVDEIVTLKGKNLACWCPLDRPCHADVLLELANQ